MRRTPVLSAVTLVACLTILPALGLAQTTDEEAIKSLLHAETNAFYAGDQNQWAAGWLHDAQANRALVSNGQFLVTMGWDQVLAQTGEFMKNISAPVSVEFTDDEWVMQVHGTMAAVQYRQTTKTPQSPNGEPSHSREYRVLVKQGTGWKIVSMMTVATDSFNGSPQAVEAGLNANGYQLLEAKKAMDAIEVFKLVVKLYPQSWNAYDSLGEAYAVAGNKALAIENYEKSLELNPKNESGRAALAKLKQQ